MEIKDRVKWYGLVSGGLFIAVSTYLHLKFVFESTTIVAILYTSASLSAAVTLILGILSLPRWQSFVAIAIFGYALFWWTLPAYAIP